MRFLLLYTLGLLAACAGPSADPDTRSASLTSSADPIGVMESAASIPYLDDVVLGSAAERAAIERETKMLAELAAGGIYPETRPTQITVKYHRSGTTIGLYNEANVSQSDYYNTSRTSARYKVIPNIEMGALLKAFEDLGFYREALDGIKRVSGASLSIVVRRGSESWTLSWGQSMGRKNNELTQTCADAVRIIFDTTHSLQRVDNPDGTDFFLREQERINRANALRRSRGGH